MLPVQKFDWWEEIVSRLSSEPLWRLAAELELDEVEVERALADATPEGPATEAPWWPEAVRRVAAGASIRDTARRFGTNARRLRRNLARAGVRAGGEDVREYGVERLAPFLDQLGKAPDAAIARRAHVTIQAVQGERRRLGVDAYVPPPPQKRRDPAPPSRFERSSERGRAPRAFAREPAAPTVVRRAAPSPPRPTLVTRAPAPDSSGRPALPRLGGLPTLPKKPHAEALDDGPERRRRRRVRPDDVTAESA